MKASVLALQAMYDRMLGSFVLPLVVGGDVLVSYPIGTGAFRYFLDAQPTDSEVAPAILRGRAEVLRELLLSPAVRPLAGEELALLTSLHNVLLVAHEDLAGGFRGSARWRHCLRWGLEQLSLVPPCESAATALARHSLLHQVTELTRRDVLVTTRLGQRKYLGQDPPRSALIWPRLRRLTASESVAPLPRVVPGEDARRALSALLEQSPLTCLMSMPYAVGRGGGEGAAVHTAELRFSPSVVAVLGSPELCRAVTYRHLELGFKRVGRPLTRALLSGVERSASAGPGTPEMLRMAFGLRYVVNLQLTHCWTEADPEALRAPLEEPWGDAEAEADRAFFFGWAAAALARADRIGAPQPGDPEMAERERRYQVVAAAVAGPALEDAARHVDWLVPPEGPRPEA